MKKIGIKTKMKEKLKYFFSNCRLRACLAMCLIFQQSKPSMLINYVLTEKKMCIHGESDLNMFNEDRPVR